MNSTELSPVTQNKLYGFNNTFLEVVDLYNKKRLPNSILFSGQKGVGKSTLAYHFINYIFSQNEEFKYNLEKLEINTSNKSFKLVTSNSHPNFYLLDVVDDKNVIEVSQIRKMITYTNKSSFNNKERIILIDNVEKLNLNSLNALLKITEEPNVNVFFILIFDNNKKILDTLRSRCLKFNFSLNYKEGMHITNLILNNSTSNCINKDFYSYYDTPGNYFNLVKFSNENKLNLNEINLDFFLKYLIENNFYKKDLFIKNNIYRYIELYLFKLFNYDKSRMRINNLYKDFIKKIHNMKKYNLDEESFFIEFKDKVLNG